VGERLSILSESRVRETRSLGSMKRDVETESWRLDCGTAIRKGRQQLRGAYRHRATSRLYDELRARKEIVSINNAGERAAAAAIDALQQPGPHVRRKSHDAPQEVIDPPRLETPTG